MRDYSMSRRAFLATAAGAAALAPHVEILAQPPRRSGMYVSLNGSLTRQMPWPDFVRLASKLGYGGVDVNFNAAKADGVEATRAMLKELNLAPAVCNLPVPYASADEAAFAEAMKQLDENARFANAIGLNRMMVVLSPSSQMPKAERRTFLKARLTPISEVLQRHEIRLGLEFLGVLSMRQNPKSPEPFIWTLPETVAFAKEIGPNIGAVLDAWHWHLSGGTVPEILGRGQGGDRPRPHLRREAGAGRGHPRQPPRHAGRGQHRPRRLPAGAEEDRLRGWHQPGAAWPHPGRDDAGRRGQARAGDDGRDDEESVGRKFEGRSSKFEVKVEVGNRKFEIEGPFAGRYTSKEPS